MRTVLLLLVLPLAFVGMSLLPGRRFLPILPAAYAPFSIEDPGAAEAARVAADYPGFERVLGGLPEDVALREAWRAHSMPGWDPRSGLGMPLAARTNAWYPPHVLAWILPPGVGAGLEALITLFMAGLGLWWLLRTLGTTGIASVFGAWAFQSGAFAIVSLHVPERVDAALWLPFALAGVERLVARKKWGGITCSGAIAMSFLAGCVPMAVLVAAATFAWAVWRSITARAGLAIAKTFGWMMLGIGAGAIAWLPHFEAQSESIGVRQGAEFTALQSLPLATTATLLVPDLFGSASDPWPARRDPVTWWLTPKSGKYAAQTASTIEWDLFAGVGVLVLAIAGIAARWRACALPLVLLVVSLGFAQGWPGIALAYHVPGFDLMAPAIAAGIAWTCWPILAAFGLEALIERRPRAWRSIQIAAVVVLVVGGVLALTFAPETFQRDFLQAQSTRYEVPVQDIARVVPGEFVHAGFVRALSGFEQLALVALGLVAAAFLSRRLARRGTVAEVAPWFALAAIEGCLLAHAHLEPRFLGDQALFPNSEAMSAIAETAGDGRVVRFDADPTDSSDAAELAPADLLSAYGIRDLAPHSELAPQSLVELMATLDPRSLRHSGLGPLTDVDVLGRRVLDLLRVTCVIAREPIRSSRLHVVWSKPGFYVHARAGAMSAARVVPSEAVVTSSEMAALQLVADPSRDPRTSVVIVSGDLPAETDRPHSNAGPFIAGEVDVSSKALDRVDARVVGSSGGWLVFHEQWYPGWKATVNGADAPVVRADHVFRAVAIPPGDSVVRTKYEPTSIRAGAWMTLGACAVAAAIVVLEGRKKAVVGAV